VGKGHGAGERCFYEKQHVAEWSLAAYGRWRLPFVDRDVDVFSTGAAGSEVARSAAADAVGDALNAAELLDVDVDELARAATLVAERTCRRGGSCSHWAGRGWRTELDEAGSARGDPGTGRRNRTGPAGAGLEGA
jgi:hypothetical protein